MSLIKEGWLLLLIGYYECALGSMGPSHKDYPDVLIHVLYLREKLAHIRGIAC